MEIKIPKEVRQHSETIFFGLSTRQFICAVLAVGRHRHLLFDERCYRQRNGQLGLHRGRRAAGCGRLLSL